MDWQEPAALLVVALTAAAFAWRAARRRRRSPGLPCGTACGCSSATSPARVTYAARKGERPRIHVKATS